MYGGLLGKNGANGKQYQNRFENCYNIGVLNLQRGVSYGGFSGIGAGNVINCYNGGKMQGDNLEGVVSNVLSELETIEIGYYDSNKIQHPDIGIIGGIDVSEKTLEEAVNLLNSYKDETGNYPSNWKKWKVGEGGYPEFE